MSNLYTNIQPHLYCTSLWSQSHARVHSYKVSLTRNWSLGQPADFSIWSFIIRHWAFSSFLLLFFFFWLIDTCIVRLHSISVMYIETHVYSNRIYTLYKHLTLSVRKEMEEETREKRPAFNNQRIFTMCISNEEKCNCGHCHFINRYLHKTKGK